MPIKNGKIDQILGGKLHVFFRQMTARQMCVSDNN